MYYVMSSPQIKAQNNYQSNYAHFCHLSKNKTCIFNEMNLSRMKVFMEVAVIAQLAFPKSFQLEPME